MRMGYIFSLLTLLCCSKIIDGSSTIAPVQKKSELIKSSKYLISNINVISLSTGDPVLKNQNVLIEFDTIKNISPQIEFDTSGAFMIDGTNKFLIPAFYDMHTHVTEDNDLFLYLANGVTTIRHMWGNERLLEIRDRIKNGQLLSPQLKISSPGFEQPPSYWPNTILIEKMEDIEEKVKTMKSLGYDFIKIYENLSKEFYIQILESAEKIGIEPIGHIPYDVSLDKVLELGMQTSIEHLDSYLENIARPGTSINDPKNFMIDEGKLISVVKKTIKSRIWHCPTITITTRHLGQKNKLLNNPNLQYVSPTMKSWFISGGGKLNSWDADNYTKHKLNVIKAFYEAKVPMILGTDTGLRYILPGFSVHEELKYLAEAGIPAIEVLKIASSNCSEYLHMSDKLGTISIGKMAEVIVLNSNPISDIENAKDIFGVLTQGMWLSTDFIQLKLFQIKEEYK